MDYYNSDIICVKEREKKERERGRERKVILK
jgi:hypothetical protein